MLVCNELEFTLVPSHVPPSSQEHVLSQSRSQYIKAKVNTSHHKKKADGIRDTLKKGQKLITVKEQELEEGQQEIAELERTWKSYEKQVKKEGVSRMDIELDEDQVRMSQMMASLFPSGPTKSRLT